MISNSGKHAVLCRCFPWSVETDWIDVLGLMKQISLLLCTVNIRLFHDFLANSTATLLSLLYGL